MEGPNQQYDLVVIGSGVAGCAAALAASAHGLDVCLLEKSDRLGGGSAYSLGALWVGANHLMSASGLDDTLDDARAYLEFLAGGAAISRNLETYVAEGPRILQAFEELGLEFRTIEGLPDYYYPSAPGSKAQGRSVEAVPIAGALLGSWSEMLQEGPYAPRGMTWSDAVAWGGFGNRRGWDGEELARRANNGIYGAGQGVVAQFLAGLVKRNVPIFTKASARSLITRDDRVVGVRGEHRGDVFDIRAACGVVLATGGYEGNPELIRNLEGVPDWHTMFPPTVDGDALRIGTEIGAAVYRVPVNLCLLLGYLIPSPSGEGEPEFRNAGPREFTFPHCFMANSAGQRFANESQFQHMVPALRQFDVASHTYTNLPCFLIFDRQYLDRYSFASLEPGSPTPDWVNPSDTVEELAEQLHIDPAGLAETVRIFNEGAARGEDPAFGRGKSVWSRVSGGDRTHAVNPNLGTIEKPPFCGVRLYPTGTGSAGLLTNEYGGVMHVRGHHIPGLYACGNAAAPTDFGTGYQAGLSLMSGIIYGNLAVDHAAGTSVI